MTPNDPEIEPEIEPEAEAGSGPLSEAELLGSVLDKTARLLAGVRPEQAELPTPCPGLDVADLVAHVAGWAASFAAQVTGETFEGDPDDFRPGPDPAAGFRVAADQLVTAYREGGQAASRLPVGLLLVEFVGHGWDLAVATGQPVEFTAAEAGAALADGRRMLQPAYRGPGKCFGYEVEVPESVDALGALVAFLGRPPDWRPPAA